jgi:ankyrin repeat protein
MVAALLAAGAACDPRDAHGWTPLLHACRGGHTRCAQALLAAGADPNAQCARELFGVGAAAAALGVAASAPSQSQGELVALLLAHGADPFAGRFARAHAAAAAARLAAARRAHVFATALAVAQRLSPPRARAEWLSASDAWRALASFVG